MSTEIETEFGDSFDIGGSHRGARLVRGASGVVAFLGIWWVAALFSPTYVLPSPDVVAETFWVELASGSMLTALGQSVTHWLPGAVVGTVLGVALGVALAWSQRLDDVAAPIVRVLRPVPPLALIGFAIAWFGINHGGAAFIIAAGAFWINYYATYGGVQGVSEDLIDVARSLGANSTWGQIRQVVLPAASPEILTGIRTGVGRSWMLILAAEIFGVPGVGRTILTASNNLSVDVVIAYIALMSLVYLVVDSAFERVQRRLLAWR
ncbi:ABC transporter permease [Haloprofundus sp. MHR1]|uniref:ABC transporter permease n=1 Tax=Haloprofundus sp. MHR1 TaxID=2572921 RepID=UPI0010BE74D9|nr:ABC transporter permease [Haloprofundus sp. MHR1]QCJ47478.1 ABC transporter permease [Haloprofundus sp. MHR1]